MALYTPLLIYLNNTQLAKPLRPSVFINITMGIISLFYLYFAYRVVLDRFF